jgi:hypothetical protein
VKVVGYLRVSTAQQEYGIEAQRTAILAEATRRGWQVEFVEDAGRSGKDIDGAGITPTAAGWPSRGSGRLEARPAVAFPGRLRS